MSKEITKTKGEWLAIFEALSNLSQNPTHVFGPKLAIKLFRLKKHIDNELESVREVVNRRASEIGLGPSPEANNDAEKRILERERLELIRSFQEWQKDEVLCLDMTIEVPLKLDPEILEKRELTVEHFGLLSDFIEFD